MWSPNTWEVLLNLSVRNGALLNIPAVAHLSYCDRLKALRSESLEFSQLRYILVMIYKLERVQRRFNAVQCCLSMQTLTLLAKQLIITPGLYVTPGKG